MKHNIGQYQQSAMSMYRTCAQIFAKEARSSQMHKSPDLRYVYIWYVILLSRCMIIIALNLKQCRG